MTRHGKKFVIGALVGTVLGSVTALLFAPKSGAKMRRDISKQCRNAADKTQDMMKEVSHKTQCAMNSITDQVNDLVDKAQDIKEKAKDAIESISDTARKRRK